MRKIVLFVEDFGHEEFLKALLERVAKECKQPIKPIPRSVRGGRGKMLSEFKEYLRDVRREREGIPDLIVVASDANCQGYVTRRDEFYQANQQTIDTLYAIPDPHIERWMLLDSAAFKSVFGKGCQAPDYKCSKDRYKKLLLEAILHAGTGVLPPLGGMEYAKDVVDAIDLVRMEQADTSLGRFLQDLKRKFNEWKA